MLVSGHGAMVPGQQLLGVRASTDLPEPPAPYHAHAMRGFYSVRRHGCGQDCGVLWEELKEGQ